MSGNSRQPGGANGAARIGLNTRGEGCVEDCEPTAAGRLDDRRTDLWE